MKEIYKDVKDYEGYYQISNLGNIKGHRGTNITPTDNGIGYKIASHWLRNMGFYIPVIDLHIKNLLYNFKITIDKNINYQTYEKIQNKLIEEIEIDNISFDLALWYYGKNYCSNPVKCSSCKFNIKCRK